MSWVTGMYSLSSLSLLLPHVFMNYFYDNFYSWHFKNRSRYFFFFFWSFFQWWKCFLSLRKSLKKKTFTIWLIVDSRVWGPIQMALALSYSCSPPSHEFPVPHVCVLTPLLVHEVTAMVSPAINNQNSLSPLFSYLALFRLFEQNSVTSFRRKRKHFDAFFFLFQNSSQHFITI